MPIPYSNPRPEDGRQDFKLKSVSASGSFKCFIVDKSMLISIDVVSLNFIKKTGKFKGIGATRLLVGDKNWGTGTGGGRKHVKT